MLDYYPAGERSVGMIKRKAPLHRLLAPICASEVREGG